jgi:hypothetical protein
VLCDSAGETGVTAWRAGGRIWPEWEGPEPPQKSLIQFLRMRPLLETGHQAIFLMRLICTGADEGTIELRFHELCERLHEKTGYSTAKLARLFADTRDAWIDLDEKDWLSRHNFYPEIVETFAARVQNDPVFILTTKQKRFVKILLRFREIPLPDDHIFGLDDGKSKEDLLEQLTRRTEFGCARFHFAEDRLETLMRVAKRDSLKHILLYLADWGYNTRQDRAKVRSNPRITIWDSKSFMNVNDSGG